MLTIFSDPYFNDKKTLFLPSACQRSWRRRPSNHFLTPPPPSGLYWNRLLKGPFDDQWRMTMILWHVWHMWRRSQVWHPWHVSHCDTMQHNISPKSSRNAKIWQLRNEIDLTHCDTVTPMWLDFTHCDTVTPMWLDFTHCDTVTPMWHRKSSNSLDPWMTSEGTVGAPTCFYKKRHLASLNVFHLLTVDLMSVDPISALILSYVWPCNLCD